MKASLLVLSLIISFVILIAIVNDKFPVTELNQNTEDTKGIAATKPVEEESVASFEVERLYFSEWNHPFTDGIPPSVQQTIWDKIKALPSEEQFDNVVGPWKSLGPSGINYPDSPSIKYSGRVKDIEPPTSTTGLRVGAASGGIWQYNLFFPVCLSNGIETPWLGSFCTDPDNSNIIYAGTGEPRVQAGRGLWRTTDGGVSWQQVNFNNHLPWCFYKIRFDPNNSNKVHAATSDGYFQSTDNGNSWALKYTGLITDFAVNIFNNSSVVYIAQKNPSGLGGILKSTDGGNNFSRLYGLPTNNLARSVIDCGSSPNIVYALLGNGSNDSLRGVYRSDNSGTNWTDITPQNAQVFGLPAFEYMAAISVCPANAFTVLIANKSLCRSTDGGQSWTEYCDDGTTQIYRNLHGDHHRLAWKDGNTVYSANDGGIAVSSDRGATWNNVSNYLPITQVYHFDVGVSNTSVMFAGTQDNGTIKTVNLGLSWQFNYGGDGGTVEIDHSNSNKVFITHNAGGNITFRRFRTTDGGQTIPWPDITGNLPPHDDWVTRIACDQTPPVYLYTNAGPYVYKTTNEGTNWTLMNSTAFPTPKILNLSVTKYTTGGSVVYACLRDAQESGSHAGRLLRVFDNGTWYERSTGLPQNDAFVRNIALHPTNTNMAYALMNGVLGQKVFKTTNRGVSWSNITGNLPNVPVSDLIPHPTDNNKLYLSSEFGCFKTTNGGTNWIRWNYGMPDRLPQCGIDFVINDMDVIDSLSQNGKYYILAATYGRGIWMREISTDDPIGIINNSEPIAFELSQNYPNPFNPSTKIDFSIPKSSLVEIKVYDELGRLVRTILNEKRSAGIYTVDFKADNISSGVYFYKIIAGDFTDVKKMVILK